MQAIFNELHCTQNKGYLMNYLVAIVALFMLATINIFGNPTETVNTIISSAIAAAIWGGNQRKAGQDDLHDFGERDKRK